MYFSPYIDESGYHYPTYNDILDNLIESMQTIYGAGIYLGVDSMDYQMLAIFAEKTYDVFQAVEMAYNARSPVTAIGTALDAIVAINGITRKPATQSTAEVLLTGTAGTVIAGAYIADDNGFVWDLPATVTLDSDGLATVTATCRIAGAIQAPVGSITRIMTPVTGWTAVTNTAAAVLGNDVESDASLRARQAAAVAIPAQSVTDGLRAALSALEDVGRCKVYENDTATTDANGIPRNSICCVVEDGTPSAIAKAICDHKSIGCGTYGTTSVSLTSADTGIGSPITIKYQPLTKVSVDVEITIDQQAGYSSAYVDLIKQAVVDYLAGFGIGDKLSLNMLMMVALGVNPDLRSPAFTVTSVEAARHGSTLGTSDVAANFDEALYADAADITITVT